jgi:hypothetical protein
LAARTCAGSRCSRIGWTWTAASSSAARRHGRST